MKERTILHIDMNAFFASVEQRANPALRGKPVAVIGSAHRTVVTTASYEAREFGVKTGMNKFEARRQCPGIIFVVGDNRKYIDTSVRILEILKDFSPKVEAYSIDEAFVDITGTQGLFGEPQDIAAAMKKRIRDGLGLSASIGIAPNKLLAKLASDMKKPDGLVVIKQDEVASILEDMPVGELWGIGSRLTQHLASMGIRACGELSRFPTGTLRERFGMIGERLKHMAQGIDDSPVVSIGEEDDAKSVGHSTTLPSDISDRGELKKHLLKLSEMVGRRERRYCLKGRKVTLTIRYADFYTFTRQRTLAHPVNDTRAIYLGAAYILDSIRLRSPVRLIGVSISGMVKETAQMPLFEEDRKREALLGAMDSVNDLFGEFTVTWGTLLERTDEPGVISPAWRPQGIREGTFL